MIQSTERDDGTTAYTYSVPTRNYLTLEDGRKAPEFAQLPGEYASKLAAWHAQRLPMDLLKKLAAKAAGRLIPFDAVAHHLKEKAQAEAAARRGS